MKLNLSGPWLGPEVQKLHILHSTHKALPLWTGLPPFPLDLPSNVLYLLLQQPDLLLAEHES